MKLHGMRENYRKGELDESSVDSDPLTQLRVWLDEAVGAGEPEPNAMTLATVDGAGRPSARIVLLKEIRPAGIVFFTDYRSRKGTEIAVNPQVALVLHWHGLERQVRITGKAMQIPGAESDAYHEVRPVESQLGAWTSRQSSRVAGRAELEAALAATRQKFEGREIARPEHWGGYLVAPEEIEFWQGRPGRLHDRILFTLTPEQEWSVARLSP